MKTTATVLGGILALSLVANTFGETTNVYSKNAVGYVNVPINTSFTLMSIQLSKDSTGSLTIGDILPSAADGTTLYIYSPTLLNYLSFLFSDGQWYDMQTWEDGSTQTLVRGIGFWVGWTGAPTNISIVGEVPGTVSATTLLTLPSGYVLMSYPYPVAAALTTTQLGQNAQDGDEIFVWTGSNYKTYGKFTDWYDYDTWGIVDPVLSPGQGFWYKNTGTQRNVNETKPYTWP